MIYQLDYGELSFVLAILVQVGPKSYPHTPSIIIIV